MSELKRKREDNDPEGEEPCAQDATRVAEPNESLAAPPSPVAPTASVAAAAMPPSTTDINTPIERAAAAALADTAPPASSSSSSGVSATAATTADGDAVVKAAAASTTSAASSSSSPPSARNNERAPKPTKKILICGKEVTLKDTGGRKKRKQPMEALVILAYKGQLAMACKVNSMLSALEIYQDMKSKGIKQDLSTHLMVLSLCGGSPGEKDELDPGNGSTRNGSTRPHHAATLARAAADDAAALAKPTEGEVGNASAQENTHAAAEAALQIFSDASNGGAVSLPESAYTAVIRACCLDGRADRGREFLEALKRADVRPRVRTYAPLLEAYSGLDGRLQDCMDIWHDAVAVPEEGRPGITMTEREYLHLVAACTRAKDEKCFLEVMEEYMDDVLQPRSRHSWDVLKAWFKVAPNDIGNGVTEQVKPAAAAQEEKPEASGNGDPGGGKDGAVEPGTSSTAVATEAEDTAAAQAAGVVEAEQGTVSTTVTTEAVGVPAASEATSSTPAPSDAPEQDTSVSSSSPSPSKAVIPKTPGAAEDRDDIAAAADGDDSMGLEKKSPRGDDKVDADSSPMETETEEESSSRGGGCCGGDGDAIGMAKDLPSDEGVCAAEGADADVDADAALKESPSGSDGSWIVTECKVDEDGTCNNCGEVLKSIDLSPDDERRLLEQINVMVCTNEQRTKQWEGFRGWLDRRGKERYNVIIDGANVGYYKQAALSNSELADLEQVDWAVRKYEKEGKKPLVVLHSRHLVENRLSDEANEIYKRWKEEGVIQSCAPKNNDDWYWLYAAVYTGGAVLVLTNDEMRDHHFSMLSHRSFQRWRERHQTRFSFGEWNEEGDMRELIADEPRTYSKRTQKGVDSWHVPLEGSGDWLCARWRR